MEKNTILISQPQAARMLGVSVRTVCRLVDAGVLRPIRLTPRGHRHFRRDDVEELAGQYEAKAAP